MRYDEFINKVQQKGKFDSLAEAQNATQAVLETLGERLDRTVRNTVTAQLPDELKRYHLNKWG